MPKSLLILLAGLLLSANSFAQLGGQHTFSFLNLSPSARVSALGGNLITVIDDDVNLAYANPALLNTAMHHQLAFNHNFHLGRIQNGYAAFGNHLPSINTTFHLGMQYVNYGELEARNELGELEGNFKAAEYALALGAARRIDERITIGANVKMITSQLDVFSSIGLSTDIAAIYADTANRLTATVVFRNMGTQITPYRDGNFEPLPFEIQVGISKRLKYLPFRFSIIYHNLQRWNIIYDDPNRERNPLFIGQDNDQSRFELIMDNLVRHFIFNGEFLFGAKENFRLRVGYNHFLRKEMTVESFGSLAGFSFGAGVKVNRFRLDYGRAIYHIAGGLNHLSIQTNLSEFRK